MNRKYVTCGKCGGYSWIEHPSDPCRWCSGEADAQAERITDAVNDSVRMKRAVNEMDWLFRQYLRAIRDLPDYELAITELTVMQLAAWAKDQA